MRAIKYKQFGTDVVVDFDNATETELIEAYNAAEGHVRVAGIDVPAFDAYVKLFGKHDANKRMNAWLDNIAEQFDAMFAPETETETEPALETV